MKGAKEIKDIFKSEALDEISQYSKENLDDLPNEKKINLASKWRRQGISVKDLAHLFNVTANTIYNWIKKDRDHFLSELEQKNGLEIVVENLDDLKHLESLCLYEASHLGADQIDIDPETGEKRIKGPSSKSLDAKSKFIKLALDCRKMQIDLCQSTGILPKIAEKIYNKIEDNKVKEEDQIDFLERKPLEEAVLEKLRNNPML